MNSRYADADQSGDVDITATDADWTDPGLRS
jgi:hypothetical protein